MFKRYALKVLAGLLFSVLPNQAVIAEVQAEDGIVARKSIVTRPNERAHILSNMRQYLTGIQEMTQALSRDDMKSAAAAARSMGMVRVYEVRLSFPNKHAIEFRDLAMELHQDFEAIAKDAEEKGDARLMLGQVARTMKKCIHCHTTYELRDMAHTP